MVYAKQDGFDENHEAVANYQRGRERENIHVTFKNFDYELIIKEN